MSRVARVGFLFSLVAGCVAFSSQGAAHALDADSTRLNLIVSDIVYDPTRDVMYASVDASDANYPNKVVTIDPDSLTVTDSRSLGTKPSALAVDASGGALYVGIDGQGAVKKFALPGFTESWSHTLGTYTGGRVMLAGDIAVMPGSTDTVAVSRRVEGLSPSLAGTVIIDGGAARPTATPGHIGSNSVTFGASGDELFGSDTESSANRFYRHDVDAGGITIRETTGLGGGQIAYHDGLVYVAGGQILDVSDDTTSIADTLTGGTSVAIDAAANTVYYTEQGYAGTLSTRIQAYDITSRENVATWEVPDHVNFSKQLITLGNDRLAYIDAEHPAQRRGTLVFVELVEHELGSLGEYTPLTPARILDTRTGLGRGGLTGRIGAGQTIEVPVAGQGGVPATGAVAVVMNVTVVDPTNPGYLTVYPAGLARPTISSLNFSAGMTIANLVTLPIGEDGRISIYNPFGGVDVLFDVAGYYADSNGPAGSRFHALPPTRVMDTRDGTGGRFGQLGTQDSTQLQLNSATVGSLPCCVGAVVLNVTITGTSAPSYLTVSPSDVARPEVSNLNYAAGDTRANQVIVRTPANGILNIFNAAGATDVIVDLVGYFDNVEDGERGRFVPFTPYRAIDTRLESPFPAPGHLESGYLLYSGDAAEPLSAYVMNVTVTDVVGAGYVSVFPYSPNAGTPPNASTLNYSSGATVPNHAISRTGPYIGFYNFGGRVQLVVDVFGAFT